MMHVVHHRPNCFRWSRILAMLACVAGCTAGDNEIGDLEGASPVAEVAAPGRLLFDLPHGVEVDLDGARVGASPLGGIDLSASPHSLTVRSFCGSAQLDGLQVAPGASRTITRDDVPDLRFARLRIDARDLTGRALDVSLTTRDVPLGKLERGVPVDVPACHQRIFVQHEGLGGFIEDLDPKPGEMIERSIVLAPGPDMVRIHGGPFKIGRPKEFTQNEEEADYIYPDVPQFDVVMPTFDVDKTEVTAVQAEACMKAAEHRDPASRVGRTTRTVYGEPGAPVVGCPDYAFSGWGDSTPGWECTTDSQHAIPGYHRFPATCIPKWFAEDYCRWVGKRLPTDVEWEYVARSRNSTYAWPWGNTLPDCERAWGRFDDCFEGGWPHLGCQKPLGNTAQGVCDMVGNVDEYVLWADVPGRARRGNPRAKYGPLIKGGHSASPAAPFEESSPYESEPYIGFRCVRDVSDGSTHHEVPR
jgi:formylglycine-generating enzyme required for sulfatase activity